MKKTPLHNLVPDLDFLLSLASTFFRMEISKGAFTHVSDMARQGVPLAPLSPGVFRL